MDFDFKLEPGRKLKKYGELEKDIKIKVSVITPFYNTKRDLIMGTANSILNQTYPCFEWLIIDDGSTNKESLKVLEELEKMDKRIRVFHKQNEGLAQTRDYGAKMASESSDYLLFIDDDDQISSTFIECAYWTLETNPEATWAYADSVGFDKQQYVWRKWFNPEKQKKENNLVSINFIRKKDFFEAGGYEIKEKSVYEDWNFWLKLISMKKYPVRMNSISLWYRRKDVNDGELAKAKANHERAMSIIRETASKVTETKNAIQYPKQDYKWDKIEDKLSNIEIPILKKNNKIKILMFIPWMVTGGGDRFNLDLISKIDKEKFEFIIVSTLPSNNEWKQKFEEEATVYDLTSFLNQKYWISFINYLIIKNNINIIFNTCCQWGYNALPYLKSQFPEIPIIDYVHMEEWYWRNGGYSRDAAQFSTVIDKTLVCNKNSENILISSFGKNEKEVQTVYIGVDEQKYNPENFLKEQILKKLEINEKVKGKFVLGYVCRISAQKRPFLLLEIIKELKSQNNDFVVIVAGDGPLMGEMESKAKSLKIFDNIVFLGKCSNTQEIYSICDLTINCSIKEGLALTSYESLSMGVPVISSDVGGQKELISNDVGKIVKCYQKEIDINNYNYSKMEIKDYVDGIRDILNNLVDYKKNCRKKILSKFTINKMINNMEEIFQNTLQNPNEEKIKNGKELFKFKDITKELISSHMMCSAKEYEWLTLDFNKKNVDAYFECNENKKEFNYEQTLGYKIKHPIVVILRKIGIYDFCKRIIKKV